MAQEQSERITIPVTREELATVEASANAGGSTLVRYCREQLGLVAGADDSGAVRGADELQDALVAALSDDSVQPDTVVDRLKRAPSTDAAELDRALAVVRDALSAERAFARDARIAISAIEQDSD